MWCSDGKWRDSRDHVTITWYRIPLQTGVVFFLFFFFFCCFFFLFLFLFFVVFFLFCFVLFRTLKKTPRDYRQMMAIAGMIRQRSLLNRIGEKKIGKNWKTWNFTYDFGELFDWLVLNADKRRFVLVLLLVALWFILRGDLLYVFPCVILFLCFSVLLVLRLPRLGKRELILVLFVRLFGLCLFRFVGFLFLLGSGEGCGLWLWHSLDFSLTFFVIKYIPLPVGQPRTRDEPCF